MPLTIDDIPDWFFGQVLKKNRSATDDNIIKAYEEEQGKQTRLEEQRGKEFEYCYWFCAILQEREAVVSWGRAGS